MLNEELIEATPLELDEVGPEEGPKRIPFAYAKRNDKKEILPSEEFKYMTYSSVVVWLRSKLRKSTLLT